MRFQTKQKRLIAIIDKWRELHGKRPFTMDEVHNWALTNGLFPVPKRGCAEQDAEEWEAKLDKATATATDN